MKSIATRAKLHENLTAVFVSHPQRPLRALSETAAQCRDLQLTFQAAYQFAVRLLVDGDQHVISPMSKGAFAFSERGGNRVDDIATTLSESWEVTGTKSFVTEGSNCDKLLVVGKSSAKNAPEPLALCLVDRAADSIASRLKFIKSTKPLPFIPDIDHCAIEFDRTPSTLLSQFGVSASRSFRVIEDVCVGVAVGSFFEANLMDSLSKSTSPASPAVDIVAQLRVANDGLLNFGPLPSLPPSGRAGTPNRVAPKELVRLHGLLEINKTACGAAVPLLDGEAAWRAELQRDLKLLTVAQKVRDARVLKALSELAKK